jgi:hypothetical protein
VTFDWPDPRCIVCLSDDQDLTKAHLIPEAIGGRLAVPFLCGQCNSYLGAKVEAGLKEDPITRLALAAMEDQVPAIAKIGEGQLFAGEGPDELHFQAVCDEKKFRVLPSPQEDGSMVKSDEDAIKHIETVLRREGRAEDDVEAAIARVKAAPRGERLPVAPGIEVKKGSTASFLPDLRRPFAPDLRYLGIAYLFVALNLGVTIYHGRFQRFHDALQGSYGLYLWTVTPASANRDYEPWHGLRLIPESPALEVEVRLFGSATWNVGFGNVGIIAKSRRQAYRQDLLSGEQEWTLQPMASNDG